MRIEWEPLEGHEKGFHGRDRFREFCAAVRPTFSDTDEMKHYRLRPPILKETGHQTLHDQSPDAGNGAGRAGPTMASVPGRR